MSIVYHVEPKNQEDINGVLKYLYDLHKTEYDDDLNAFQSVCYVDGTPGFGSWGDPWVTANPYYIGNDYKYSWSSLIDNYAYISYKFVGFYLRITHYSIRSHGFENIDMPKGWIVFGSNDNAIWDVVDEEKNRNELLEIDRIHTYNVSRIGIYKYFKLIVTENKRTDEHVLSFGKIDFFGDLLFSLPNGSQISIHPKQYYNFKFLILIFIML